ncbi:hypothetical protein CDIK_1671 [Cucumispora dikerogammari]|nr:hypothetical protein CDIK_1671 [Cucumispora dikerogammari]
MFLFTCILICEQIFCDKIVNIMSIPEEEFKVAFNKLDYNKKIEYNFEPFFKCLQEIIKQLEPKESTNIIENLKENGISEQNVIVNISVPDFYNKIINSVNKTCPRQSYLEKLVFWFFETEAKILEIYLALDYLPRYEKVDEYPKYRLIKNFFYSLGFHKSELSDCRERSSKEKNILKIAREIFADWYKSHFSLFSKAFEQKKKTSASNSLDETEWVFLN